MGWASYFEDILLRHVDAEQPSAAVIQGPAGSPPPQPSPPLAASYTRLRSHYGRVRPDVIRQYEEGRWQALSTEMDALEEEIRRFDRRTVLASQAQLLAQAGGILGRLQRVLARASAIISYLDHSLSGIDSETENICRLKQQACNGAIPGQDLEIERKAIWLLHGWRALRQQSREVEERAEDLEVELSGEVFERLMSKPMSRGPDKDSRQEDY